MNEFMASIEYFSPILEDVDGNEGKHGGVDDEEQQDWQVKPHKLAYTTIEMTAPEQNVVKMYFL